MLVLLLRDARGGGAGGASDLAYEGRGSWWSHTSCPQGWRDSRSCRLICHDVLRCAIDRVFKKFVETAIRAYKTEAGHLLERVHRLERRYFELRACFLWNEYCLGRCEQREETRNVVSRELVRNAWFCCRVVLELRPVRGELELPRDLLDASSVLSVADTVELANPGLRAPPKKPSAEDRRPGGAFEVNAREQTARWCEDCRVHSAIRCGGCGKDLPLRWANPARFQRHHVSASSDDDTTVRGSDGAAVRRELLKPPRVVRRGVRVPELWERRLYPGSYELGPRERDGFVGSWNEERARRRREAMDVRRANPSRWEAGNGPGTRRERQRLDMRAHDEYEERVKLSLLSQEWEKSERKRKRARCEGWGAGWGAATEA